MMKILGSLLKLEIMSGYRTYVAAVGAIALGIYLITQGQIEEGIASIVGGIGLLGLGGKSEKTDKKVAEKIKELENRIIK